MAIFFSSPSSILVGTVAAIVAAKLAYELFFSPLSAFPGPFVSKITDGWRAYLATRGKVDQNQLAWHRRWGTAVRVGPNTISLNDPDLIKTVYASKNAWRKSDMYRPNDIVVNGKRMSNIFSTQDKAFHAKYTKPIIGFWSMSKVLELEPLLDETLKLFVEKLQSEFVDEGKVCMLENWLSYFTWDAMANVSFGRPYGFIEEGGDVGNIISESTAGLKYFAAVSQIPWLDEWLDKSPVYRIGPRPFVTGVVYAMRILNEHQQQAASGTNKRRDQGLFIDKYTGLKEQYDYVDDQQVITWLLANVLAGGDSTGGAIRPVFYHLAKQPEKYATLVEELEAAKLSFPAQWDDLIKLPYLDACIKESFRLNPGAGLIIEREVPAEGLILPDGRFIPAGTSVGLNPAVVTRDEGVFGAQVDEYVPERWFRNESESDAEYSSRLRRMNDVTGFMFGAGNRACLGKHLAKLELYKLVATLYSTFDIKLRDADHEWTYDNSWFMYHRNIPVILTPRVRT
ncbi:cytochrome p450 domain-containing protein [Sarocladium implicatum]|nr:cytochrome p450 domain-containing protein [Sarocladium implicatum]